MSDISGKYVGGCINGLAHGKGKAKGAKDTYEGEFQHGNMHGKGNYIRADGTRYEGEFKNNLEQGFGKRIFLRENIDLINSWRNEGKWVGNVFVLEGIYKNSTFEVACSSPQSCQQAQTKRDAELLAETPCYSVHPGKTGTYAGSSSLSIDVSYVVRYVNKDSGTATIEATTSGQLNMDRGAMKEVRCRELK